MDEIKGELLFSSWKEIAAYLGVDERTCQRWELRYGLPVQRLDKRGSARVYANKTDLDAWREKSFRNGALINDNKGNISDLIVDSYQAAIPRKARPKRRVKHVIWAGAAFFLVIAVIYFVFQISRDRQPADFHLAGSELIIANKSGRELGRYNSGKDDLYDESLYRSHFQYKRMISTDGTTLFRSLPWLIIRDLNRDGWNEVLFAACYQDELRSDRVILLDHRMHLVGSLSTGEAVLVGEKNYSADFVIAGIDVLDFDKDGHDEILILSHAKEEFPTRALLLDQSLKIKAEYWNAGQISDYALHDFDKDGKPELLLSGQNNEYKKPCLILLDPAQMSGCSPQGKPFRFHEKKPGTELLYVLLPLSPVQALGGVGIAVTRLDILLDNRIRGYINIDSNYFDLDFNLRPLAVTLSHVFERLYSEALRGGQIKVPLDIDKVSRDLLENVLWFDGKTESWSKTWTRSNPR